MKKTHMFILLFLILGIVGIIFLPLYQAYYENGIVIDKQIVSNWRGQAINYIYINVSNIVYELNVDVQEYYSYEIGENYSMYIGNNILNFPDTGTVFAVLAIMFGFIGFFMLIILRKELEE